MELTINIKDKKAYGAFLKFLHSVGIKNLSKEFAKKRDKVLINIDLPQADTLTKSEEEEYKKEHDEFIRDASIMFGMQFDDDEPDISHLPVKEPNPTFDLNA